MMTILSSIKAASLQARKDKNQAKAALLSTLISDVTMVGKNDGNRDVTEGEVISIIKKYIVNATETVNRIKAFNASKANLAFTGYEEHQKCLSEIEVLTSFLPSQLTVEQLEKAVESVIASIENATPKDMGKVMKALKSLHDGQYDARIASELIKAKLNVTV